MKIVFVCHGNICRSPMAEFILRALAARAGRSAEFEISSAAATTEELGHDMYPAAKTKLRAENIPFTRHAAHLLTREEYDAADLVCVMDGENVRRLRRLLGEDTEKKIHLLMEFAGEAREVADPWYTGDFDAAYRDILKGCKGILAACDGSEGIRC